MSKDPHKTSDAPSVHKSPIAKLRQMPRPPGYVDAVMACAVKRTADFVWVDWNSPCGRDLLERYRPTDEADEDRRTAWDEQRDWQQRRKRWLSKRWWGRAWQRMAGPGDWLAAGVKFFTLGMVPACVKCGSRASRMNKAGWPLGVLMIFWPPFWMTTRRKAATGNIVKDRKDVVVEPEPEIAAQA